MTANTTFKEFVEERGIRFSMLNTDSQKYTDLIVKFNRAKIKLRIEDEAGEVARTMVDLEHGEQLEAGAL